MRRAGLGLGGHEGRPYIAVVVTAVLLIVGCHGHRTMDPSLAPIETSLARPRLHGWRHIVIHHSATDHGSAIEFHRFHKDDRGWDGLGYHFVIGNGHGSGDGEIEVGYRWMDQVHGAHAGNPEYNDYGIGICLVGNFEETDPTPAQMKSLHALVRWLMEACRIPAAEIVRHKDVRQGGPTDCPGKRFPFAEFVRDP